MLKLSVETSSGDTLQLFPSNDYSLGDVENLAAPAVSVNTASMPGMAGGVLSGVSVGGRTIRIPIVPNNPPGEKRFALYQVFRVGNPITVHMVNNNGAFKISGYVETFDGSLFGNPQTLTATIVCPSPWWVSESPEVQMLGYSQGLFEFPFAIPEEGIEFGIDFATGMGYVENKGPVECGLVIDVYGGNAPVQSSGDYGVIKIANETTGQVMIIDTGDMSRGDNLHIDTRQGHKTITLTIDNDTMLALNKLKNGSSWLTLVPGTNVLSFSAQQNAEYLDIYLTIDTQYEGV